MGSVSFPRVPPVVAVGLSYCHLGGTKGTWHFCTCLQICKPTYHWCLMGLICGECGALSGRNQLQDGSIGLSPLRPAKTPQFARQPPQPPQVT